ncbi:MAG TPA: hypothetical protein VI933_03940 [archaeon]|nr:hypothetical protein [archaeon]
MCITDLPEGHLEQCVGDAVYAIGLKLKEHEIGGKVDYLGSEFYRALEMVEDRALKREFFRGGEVEELRKRLLRVEGTFRKESMRRSYRKFVENVVMQYAQGNPHLFLMLWERTQRFKREAVSGKDETPDYIR